MRELLAPTDTSPTASGVSPDDSGSRFLLDQATSSGIQTQTPAPFAQPESHQTPNLPTLSSKGTALLPPSLLFAAQADSPDKDTAEPAAAIRATATTVVDVTLLPQGNFATDEGTPHPPAESHEPAATDHAFDEGKKPVLQAGDRGAGRGRKDLTAEGA